jgi:hypothetical protein
VRTRLAGSVLVLGLVGLGVAACGTPSSTSSGGTTTSTTTSTTSAATSSSSAAAGGTSASVCRQAVGIAQTLGQQVQVAGGNSQAITQAVRSVVPQIQSAANQATGSAKTALDNLAGALQSIENGASGPAVSTQITSAITQLVSACA